MPEILLTERADIISAALIDDETLSASGVGGTPVFSICIPTYRDDAAPLIRALSALEDAERAEIVLFDDGSGEPLQTRANVDALGQFPGRYRLVTAARNAGRSNARNRLTALATTDWLLFLDADMLPDDGRFVSRYLTAIREADGPSLIVGGFTLEQTRRTRFTALHYAQSAMSECVSAERRAEDPGRYTFTSNLLVHREIMTLVPFDPAFTGWGWEDVEWGLRVAGRYPVRHIENTASHLGLSLTSQLVKRFETSAENFLLLMARHPEAADRMPLARMTRFFARTPGNGLTRAVCRFLASDPVGIIPMPARLFGLKSLRAAAYGRALRRSTEGVTR